MSDISFENIDWNRLNDPSYLIQIGVDPTIATTGPGGTNNTPTTVGGLAQTQLSGRAVVQSILRSAGLPITPELDAYITNLTTNYASDLTRLGAVVNADIYDPSSTIGKVVDQSYPELQLRKKAGFPPITIGDVQDYRQHASEIMRTAGLPPAFYDNPDDFRDLIVNNVSPAELDHRVQQGFARVANADPTIRDSFREFFGPDGDAALAAYYLDPAKAVPALDNQFTIASIAGVGTQFGFHQDVASATRLAQRGVTQDQAQQGFAKLDTLRPLFGATASESPDLSLNDQGVNAVFGTGPGQAAIHQREEQRKAAFAGGGGSAGGTGGQSGLGSARSR